MEKRTSQQNKSLHKYFEMVADSLDGEDVRTFFKEGVYLPITKDIVKEVIWREIQFKMYKTTSTTELTTAQVSKIYDVINNQLSTTRGIYVPFPSIEMKNET